MSKEWKYTKLENPDFTCKRCGSNNIKYRVVEDYDCHEDINYHCEDCGKSWWIEGADY